MAKKRKHIPVYKERKHDRGSQKERARRRLTDEKKTLFRWELWEVREAPREVSQQKDKRSY